MTIMVHVDQTRAEDCLGASEAAGALGLDRYNPPISVWRRHRGLEVAEPPAFVREAAEWGQILEPVVRGKYALLTKSIVEVPAESAIRDGWLRCTPDGYVHDYGESVEPAVFNGRLTVRLDRVVRLRQGLLQVKTASAFLDNEWRDGPPAKYEVQCRVEMAVTGLPWCDIVCLIGGNHLAGPFRIERDLVIESQLLERLHAFWQLVQTGVEPGADDSDAYRLHLGDRLREARPEPTLVDGELATDVDRWRRARAGRIMSEREEREARNRVLLQMRTLQTTSLLVEGERVDAYKAKGTWTLRAPRRWGDE